MVGKGGDLHEGESSRGDGGGLVESYERDGGGGREGKWSGRDERGE